MYVQVDAEGADAVAALAGIPGVDRVVESDRRDGDRRVRGGKRAGAGHPPRAGAGDRRRSGWGLLEFRPMRMSLEEIFLSLTTDETADGRANRPGRQRGGAADA